MGKYVRTFREESDDLTITDDDGNAHQLQPGGWVEFRADIPLALTDWTSAETNAEVAEVTARILTRQVQAWNWTDQRGQAYPQPDDDAEAFRRALLDLYLEERVWLLNHCWQAENPNA